MRERPILFSAPMVRAILEGRKTQTRRAVKWRGLAPGLNLSFSGLSVERSGSNFVLTSPTRTSHEYRSVPQPSPYGAPGDRLWVRETWGIGSRPDPWGGHDGIEYRADEPYLEDGDLLDCHKVTTPNDVCLGDYRSGWRPSIHMPRWACRITLEVTDVRVERLQAISEADADAECFGGDYPGQVLPELFPGSPERWGHLSIPECFRRLWESINGADSWAANPWVWVISFRRVEA